MMVCPSCGEEGHQPYACEWVERCEDCGVRLGHCDCFGPEEKDGGHDFQYENRKGRYSNGIEFDWDAEVCQQCGMIEGHPDTPDKCEGEDAE